MSLELAIISVLGVILILPSLYLIWQKMPKKLKASYFMARWKELQTFCKDKSTWPQAVISADKLLDNALKKRKFKGKSMGERMVSAQKAFTDNDAVWFAHNLCKKALTDPEARLRESDVKDALLGFRQALRDLGALPNGESTDTK